MDLLLTSYKGDVGRKQKERKRKKKKVKKIMRLLNESRTTKKKYKRAAPVVPFLEEGEKICNKKEYVDLKYKALL